MPYQPIPETHARLSVLPLNPRHNKGAFLPKPNDTRHARMCWHTHVSANRGKARSSTARFAMQAAGADGARRPGEADRPRSHQMCSFLLPPAPGCRQRMAGSVPARPFVAEATCDLFYSPCKENEGRGNERALSLLAAGFTSVANGSLPLLGGFTSPCKSNASIISMLNGYFAFLR